MRELFHLIEGAAGARVVKEGGEVVEGELIALGEIGEKGLESKKVGDEFLAGLGGEAVVDGGWMGRRVVRESENGERERCCGGHEGLRNWG